MRPSDSPKRGPSISQRSNSSDLFVDIDRCLRAHAGIADEDANEDSLVGFFQSQRGSQVNPRTLFTPPVWTSNPDDERSADNGDADREPGNTLAGPDRLIGGEGVGGDLAHRLSQLFDAAGEGYRPGGGRDAYFVVRKPKSMEPEAAERLAEGFFARLQRIAVSDCTEDHSAIPDELPRIRVLEGIPPKQTKPHEGRTRWLSAILEHVPNWSAQWKSGDAVHRLRSAYYFTTCDPMVRDHLMWPLYRTLPSACADIVSEPFADYFELWRHGVKLRSYSEGQVDLYLPRN